LSKAIEKPDWIIEVTLPPAIPPQKETETNKRNFASNKGRSVRFIIIHFSVTECFKHGQHPYTGF